MSILLAIAVLGLADPPPADTPPNPPKPVDATVKGLVVNGQRAQQETAIDRQSYSVANDLQAETGSVTDVLRNIPAVQVDIEGNLTLRGQGNVTVLIDGRPSTQFSADNLAQALQATPANQIDRIEVMTNPPAEFRAEGTGGVINLVMKKAKGAGETGSVRLTAATHHNATATLNLGYNSDRLSVTGDVTYKRDTPFISNRTQDTGPGMDSQDDLVSHGFGNRWQGHAGLDYDLDSRTRLSASLRASTQTIAILNGDNFSQDAGAGPPTSAFDRTTHEQQVIDSHEAQASWRTTFGDSHDLTLNIDYGATRLGDSRLDLFDQTAPAASIFDQASSENILNEKTTFTADYQRPVAGGKLKLGYDFEYTPYHIQHGGGYDVASGSVVYDPSLRDDFRDRLVENEAYLSYERKFGKLDLLAGLRGESAQIALDPQSQGWRRAPSYARLFPNLHLTYDLDEVSQLTASFTRRMNQPPSASYDPFVYSASPIFANSGNPNIKPNDAYLYEVGYTQHHGELTLSTSLYYRDVRQDFLLTTNLLSNGVLLEQQVNAASTHVIGGEWAVGNRLTSKLTYNFSVDVLRVETTAPGINLTPDRSEVTGYGRANINWQMTPKDFLQLNLFANSRNLLPQGYAEGVRSANIGYRHTINNKVAWTLVVQDPLNSVRYHLVFDTNGVQDRRTQRIASRALLLTLVWNFAGKPKDAAFDFTPGGGG